MATIYGYDLWLRNSLANGSEWQAFAEFNEPPTIFWPLRYSESHPGIPPKIPKSQGWPGPDFF